MNPVLIDIGPVTIRWYGLMYVVAIIVGIYLTYLEVKRKQVASKRPGKGVLTLDDVLDFVLIAVPIGIVCARLYYVAFEWGRFNVPGDLAQTLFNVVKIWEGGLAIHGGVIGGILALWIFTRFWKKVAFWQFADAVAPSLILGQAFGRFGNFMNGDAYGTPTDWPTGLVFPIGTPAGREYPNQPIHPSMLYELVGNVLIFAVLWFWLRKRGYRDGFIACMYFVLYAVLRFFVELTRGDSLILADRWPAANVISVIIFVVFLGLMFQWRLWHKKAPDSTRQGKRVRNGE